MKSLQEISRFSLLFTLTLTYIQLKWFSFVIMNLLMFCQQKNALVKFPWDILVYLQKQTYGQNRIVYSGTIANGKKFYLVDENIYFLFKPIETTTSNKQCRCFLQIRRLKKCPQLYSETIITLHHYHHHLILYIYLTYFSKHCTFCNSKYFKQFPPFFSAYTI